MKTMEKRTARKQTLPSTPATGFHSPFPSDLDKVDWDFRIEPPLAKTESMKVQFVQGSSEPFVSRRKPRD